MIGLKSSATPLQENRNKTEAAPWIDKIRWLTAQLAGLRHNKGCGRVCVEHDALRLGNLFITQRFSFFLCCSFSSSIFYDVKLNYQQRLGCTSQLRLFMPRSHEPGEELEAESESSDDGWRPSPYVLRPAVSPLDNGQPRLFLIWDVFFFSFSVFGRCRLART